MSPTGLEVRLANTEDAEGILRAHYSAVHSTASADYPAEVISEWSTPVTPDRIKKYLSDSFPAELTVVAVIGCNIIGFGSIVESIGELRAVYVASEHGGQGFGSAILQKLEQLAKDKGCAALSMDSSLTAEPFYRRHGYETAGRGLHTLRSGRTMACVKMKKSLA